MEGIEDINRAGDGGFLLEGDGYVRYDGSFAADGDGRNARLVIRCPEGGKVNFGFCSLMPEDTYMGHGLRRDLVEKLRDLNPRFLRFPGGCIVEGFSPETAMQFENVAGPVWERPGHQLMWLNFLKGKNWRLCSRIRWMQSNTLWGIKSLNGEACGRKWGIRSRFA